MSFQKSRHSTVETMYWPNGRRKSITWTPKRLLGKFLLSLACAALFAFIAFVVLFPFIFGGTVLYVLVHFVHKIW